MSGANLNGDLSQKYSLSQSDDDDDNTRADGEEEGAARSCPSSYCNTFILADPVEMTMHSEHKFCNFVGSVWLNVLQGLLGHPPTHDASFVQATWTTR